MATAPNSPFLPGTGSMGELSQNSLKLLLMYRSTPLVPYHNNLGIILGRVACCCFCGNTDTEQVEWYNVYHVVALILYVATELTCNRWLRDRFGINSISIVYWMMSDQCLLGCRIWVIPPLPPTLYTPFNPPVQQRQYLYVYMHFLVMVLAGVC